MPILIPTRYNVAADKMIAAVAAMAARLTTPAVAAVALCLGLAGLPAQADWREQVKLDSTLGTELRWFPQTGLQGQAASHWSANALFEWYWQSDDEKSSWVISPYLRFDAQDSERHLLDIRQAYWLQVGDGWELKLGVDKVFWGVTESVHLVDIINQTDWVDAPDGESKFGQPLAQLTLSGDWGSLQSFVLPYFRERNYAGEDGRLRLPLPVWQDAAQYQSSAEQHHVDYALRYSRQIEQLDIALSYFAGTSREPVLQPAGLQGGTAGLIPYYRQLRQTGLELQYIVDSWIWKLEAVDQQYQHGSHQAAVAGFEYTSVGVFDSVFDLGWLAEYQYDSRGAQASTVAQRDLFVGWRLAFNDEAGSELLFGMVQDLQDGSSRNGVLEASMRLDNNIRVRLDAWWFHTNDPTQLTWWYRQDDFIQVGFDYFF